MSTSQHRARGRRGSMIPLLGVLISALLIVAANASTAYALPEATHQWGSSKTGKAVSPRNIGIQGTLTALTLGETGKVTCSATGKLALLPEGRGAISGLGLSAATCSLTGNLSGCAVKSGGASGPLILRKQSIVVDYEVAVTLTGCAWAGTYTTEALEDWEAALDSGGIEKISSFGGKVKVRYPNGTEAFTSYSSGNLTISPNDSDLYTPVSPPFATFSPFWTQDGAVLEGTAKTGFSGGVIAFASELGVIACEVSSTDVTLQAGSSGTVAPLNFQSCEGVSGVFQEAQCEFTPEGTPWSLKANTSVIDSGAFEVRLLVDESCIFGEVILFAEDLTLTPDNGKAISSLYVPASQGAIYLMGLGGLEIEAEAEAAFTMSDEGVFGLD